MSGFDEMFDWVVVGSGAGSMASALVMRSAGKSVVILEKASMVGGTTAKSGGVIWVPNNRFLKADDPDESAEKAAAKFDGDPKLIAKELQDEAMKFNEELRQRIKTVLTEVQKQKGYDE